MASSRAARRPALRGHPTTTTISRWWARWSEKFGDFSGIMQVPGPGWNSARPPVDSLHGVRNGNNGGRSSRKGDVHASRPEASRSFFPLQKWGLLLRVLLVLRLFPSCSSAHVWDFQAGAAGGCAQPPRSGRTRRPGPWLGQDGAHPCTSESRAGSPCCGPGTAPGFSQTQTQQTVSLILAVDTILLSLQTRRQKV